MSNKPYAEAHECTLCGAKEPNNGTFLGFHSYGAGEACDICAEQFGCDCCDGINAYTRRAFCVNAGLAESLRRIHDLFYQKLAAQEPNHPWLKNREV